MKRQDMYKSKLKAAKAELIIRKRILAAATRGVEKVEKIIQGIENKLQKTF